MVWTSTRVSWWVTAGATSRLENRLAARRCFSITGMRNGSPRTRTLCSVRSRKRPSGFFPAYDVGQPMKPIDQLSVKIFADGADLPGMVEMYGQPYIKGFTTNPTLMRKAGISDYPA